MDYDENDLDDALSLLSNETRREILDYLQDNEEALVEEVAHHLTSELDLSRTEAKVELRHKHLPQLEDYGIVIHDERTGVFGYDLLHYSPDEDIERLLNVSEYL